VIDAFLLTACMPKANGEIFNLGSSDFVSLKMLAKTLIALHGNGKYNIVPFPPDRKAIDIGNYYSDYKKITQSLDWKPKVSLKDGLKYTLDYFKQNIEYYT
jgi:UDP-glucose 4-epimerase